MSRELTVRIVVTSEMLHAILIASLLSAFPGSVGSETVTLQTYYPAPYGVYTQMRSLGNTTLAEASGSVGIGLGTGVGASSRLDVKGDARFTSDVTIGGPTAPASARMSVGGTAYTPGYKFGRSMGNAPSVAAENQIGTSQYLYAARSSCSGLSATGTCGGGYATWVPGVYLEGNWYDSRVGPKQAYLYFTMYNPGTGGSTNLPFDQLFDNVSITAYCCTY